MTLDGHSLAIGISRYRHAVPLPEVRDAQDVHDVLHDPVLGAYPAPGLPPLLEEAATKTAIIEALQGLARRTRESSSVFVYFSGHGGRALIRGEETCFLIPVDGDTSSSESLERTALSARELLELLRAVPAGRLTLVLDCCRASGIAEPRDAVVSALNPELGAATLSPLAKGRGRAVFAASRADGYAYVVPGQRNGVFTGHLLAGLRGAAAGVGGVIRVCDLFHYVQERVVAEGRVQQPVFKAELEENYAIAHHRASAVTNIALPVVLDAFKYDAFISYRRKDLADRAWVERVMAPRLEQLGLRICLERDFRIGESRIREMERAVTTSRYTVAVLTHAYLDGAFEEFQALIAQHNAIESKAPRFLPLLRQDCRPSLGVRMTEALDVSDLDEAGVDAALQRLALRLRERPRPKLAGTDEQLRAEIPDAGRKAPRVGSQQ